MRDEILVTGYTSPDLDGFACTFGLSDFLNQMGQKALPSIAGQPHLEAMHVVETYGLELEIKEQNPLDFKQIVLVDASELDGLDSRIDPKKVIEIIDHRQVNMAEKFFKAKVQIELVGAAATLVAEKFITEKVEIKKDIATLLYGAIISNTLNFLSKVTTERDRKVAQYLKEKFDLPNDFAHKMFLAKSDLTGAKLSQVIRSDFANFSGHNFRGQKLGISQIEIINGEALARMRKDEIISEIKKVMQDWGLDISFSSIVDLEANQNIFVVPNKKVEDLLSEILDIKFENQIAFRPGLIMRKEIVPKIRAKLLGLN